MGPGRRRSLFLLLLLACAGPPPDEIASCPAGPGPEVRVAEVPRLPAAGVAARGAPLFEAECARCHAPRVAERDSRLFRGYPRLDCATYLERASDAYLTTVISAGGPAVGLDAAMKPFGERLSPVEIADLVAYLRAAVEP